MQIKSPILFIEINDYDYTFAVCENNENDFDLTHFTNVPLIGIQDNKVSNFDLVCTTLKENIYSIEQKYNFIFKDVILIIDNLDFSIINFSGFKKLNGLQLSKENITYILNSLKTKILESEHNKKILHIFNTTYELDKKRFDNLPIGLFGNFYSHELAFFLIDNNDFKNLKNIFDKCNLRLKKIISKSFIEGVNVINTDQNYETFFKIEISENKSKLFFFENGSLKYIEKFNFGTKLILNDISKVTAIKNETIIKILRNSNFSYENFEDEIVEKQFFEEQNFRKIKKKLILDIADARIQEISEIIVFKNINISTLIKKKIPIILEVRKKSYFRCLDNIYEKAFSKNNYFKFYFSENLNKENFFKNASKIVQYGWKKEAIPIVLEKKSIISRIFDLLFN